jgi:hypothetical protein
MTYKDRDFTLTLITFLGTLSLVDVITTTAVLRQGGREMNLFLVPYASDPALFMAVKAVGLFLILGIALCCRMLMVRGDQVVLGTASGMSIYPALWNLHILSLGA